MTRTASNGNGDEKMALAEAVRAACVQAALDAYESARMDGLCNEGALEVAIGAIQHVNLARILEQEEKQSRQ